VEGAIKARAGKKKTQVPVVRKPIPARQWFFAPFWPQAERSLSLFNLHTSMSINVKEAAAQLAELYRRQAATGGSVYLASHSASRGAILRQVEAAALYEPGAFPVFHDFARLQYRQMAPVGATPYPDGYFDTVIADGVLEHVPNDQEALKELYRLLRPDGLLIISCLPNKLSYLEFLARNLGLPHHLRTYTMGLIRSMLLHSGFEVVYRRHLQMMPTLSGVAMTSHQRWLRWFASALWSLNSLLERAWPINRLSSNLLIIARKRLTITWSARRAA
jgi:SAM-dependent methyltransferase